MDSRRGVHVTSTTSTRVWVRPHRVVRSASEAARVWTQRRRTYTISAALWLGLAVGGAANHASSAATVLAGLAALLTIAVVVKAQVLIRRAQAELARTPPPAGSSGGSQTASNVTRSRDIQS